MRNSTHISYSPVMGSVCAGRQRTYTALSELSSAVQCAVDSNRSCHLLAYEVRNELIECSAAFKKTVCAESNEHVYDLATLLDLLAMTAFGAEHRQERGSIELMERSINTLQRQLADDATSERECAQMIEEIWLWLGSSNGLSARC